VRIQQRLCFTRVGGGQREELAQLIPAELLAAARACSLACTHCGIGKVTLHDLQEVRHTTAAIAQQLAVGLKLSFNRYLTYLPCTNQCKVSYGWPRAS